MKTFQFNIQSKGGAGKSMLSYLQALKFENDPKTAFIDLDSSTQTSTKQLAFLAKKEGSRLFSVDLFDNLKRIDRLRLFDVLLAFNEKEFEQIILDFGAPESEQLPSLLGLDYNIDEFKEFEKELDAKFIFNVIVCGGTQYQSTCEYLKNILKLTNGKIDVAVYLNEFTFQNYPSLIDEQMDFQKKSKGLISKIQKFGNFQPERSSGQVITETIKNGLGLGAYKSFAARTVVKRELAKL